MRRGLPPGGGRRCEIQESDACVVRTKAGGQSRGRSRRPQSARQQPPSPNTHIQTDSTLHT